MIVIVGGNEPQIRAMSIRSGSISWERDWQKLSRNLGDSHKRATVWTVPQNVWENWNNEGGYVKGYTPAHLILDLSSRSQF